MKEYSIEKLALVTRIKELEQQNKKLREALEYYADEEHLNAGYPMDVAEKALKECEE